MILIIGLGHPLRRDDGAGLWVASRLHNTDDVKVMGAQDLVPELIPQVAVADLVIFVDARVGAGPVRWERVRPGDRPALTHAFTPRGLLAWAEHLFGHAPLAWLATVPARDLSLGEGLSPRTRRAAEALVGRLRAYLGERGNP
ncbi:MAG TPA: hydrogenase maturation protease [Candidatus Bipolaricaulis anaerobius]|jgi:hydrogenase maturation protease|uniref:Bidirectional NAD-reducing hydrogenase maturation protease, Ni,Fe-hydrogenase maturation factor n=1 Tax=Candidatus Bipolaricaulis anaerobius TaxID=2026885 RepID=A0A2X3MK52_9BACT|nr:hydrogenase maturation protease [Candidatus Bipolaricaulis anaerobius]MBP7726385.1 hydrogenase maturation protease [Candidatus Bipolaricaulis sp.]MDD2912066.1 hydrogenase maturation protease [Candidatus Bipolaricaulis anaerobius]MDD3748358.1 hydrogenase maturation protease [Candidatus Bipolaricaulis anaerobius]MDD5763786.1 hydrogenase maturation protease [Candidatus Bipolaricaulis anaerobius]SQD92515.1 Bidirectional NAD-reducing hydrogenase maturation protease, Ni,Fe-hydrogenase maturation 